jgi:hypothetical protein
MRLLKSSRDRAVAAKFAQRFAQSSHKFAGKPKIESESMVQTYSRRKAVPILGITDVAIGKRLKVIGEQYPGFVEATMSGGKLTDETLELLKLWAEDRKKFEERASESSEVEASISLVVAPRQSALNRVDVPQFQMESSVTLAPESLLSLLATARDQGAIEANQQAAKTNRSNAEVLRSTLEQVENSNARIRGYRRASELDRLESEGESDFLQEKLYGLVKPSKQSPSAG